MLKKFTPNKVLYSTMLITCTMICGKLSNMNSTRMDSFSTVASMSCLKS